MSVSSSCSDSLGDIPEEDGGSPSASYTTLITVGRDGSVNASIRNIYDGDCRANRRGDRKTPHDYEAESDRCLDCRSDRAVDSRSDRAVDSRSDRNGDSRSDRAVDSRSDRAVDHRSDRTVDSRLDRAVDCRLVDSRSDRTVDCRSDNRSDRALDCRSDRVISCRSGSRGMDCRSDRCLSERRLGRKTPSLLSIDISSPMTSRRNKVTAVVNIENASGSGKLRTTIQIDTVDGSPPDTEPPDGNNHEQASKDVRKAVESRKYSEKSRNCSIHHQVSPTEVQTSSIRSNKFSKIDLDELEVKSSSKNDSSKISDTNRESTMPTKDHNKGEQNEKGASVHSSPEPKSKDFSSRTRSPESGYKSSSITRNVTRSSHVRKSSPVGVHSPLSETDTKTHARSSSCMTRSSRHVPPKTRIASPEARSRCSSCRAEPQEKDSETIKLAHQSNSISPRPKHQDEPVKLSSSSRSRSKEPHAGSYRKSYHENRHKILHREKSPKRMVRNPSYRNTENRRRSQDQRSEVRFDFSKQTIIENERYNHHDKDCVCTTCKYSNGKCKDSYSPYSEKYKSPRNAIGPLKHAIIDRVKCEELIWSSVKSNTDERVKCKYTSSDIMSKSLDESALRSLTMSQKSSQRQTRMEENFEKEVTYTKIHPFSSRSGSYKIRRLPLISQMKPGDGGSVDNLVSVHKDDIGRARCRSETSSKTSSKSPSSPTISFSSGSLHRVSSLGRLRQSSVLSLNEAVNREMNESTGKLREGSSIRDVMTASTNSRYRIMKNIEIGVCYFNAFP